MRIPIHNRLFGYVIVKTEQKHRVGLLNLLLRHRVIAYPIDACAWAVALRRANTVVRLAEKENIPLTRSEPLGLPSFFLAYARRPGIILGTVLFAVILTLSSRLVWRVEVEGNESIPDKVIEANLNELGFGIGSLSRGVDLNALAEQYRIAHEHVSYMSIYMRGTVAHVKIRETEKGEYDGEKNVPSVIVASRDATVYRMEVAHGTPAVKVGQTVKKGDVLVSGLVSGAHEDTLLSAAGEVWGVVEQKLSVDILYDQTQKMVKGREKTKISLIFFGKNINIFTNTGKIGRSYGTIEENRTCYLPGGASLPLSLAVTECVYYDAEEKKVSETEALRLAQAEMKARLSALIGRGELLGKETTVRAEKDKLILECRVRYTENIAVTVPMTESAR